ncbi:hypothetical protein ASPZODRAFT_12288 [Penicilliopsis zonata CBS 506.65]|uniref:GDS1 winged helix domain-containing protein n=1 Tax=Penicilliopsis zonata CBS 506.65 TaxID=1073090 RepID=A0A1L9SWD0_9EURO|nr:hypothetical protein ASPZODRAFT_12288 [Penicilliopsis zonata CBS 506.65]OJJ51464.1 hypothetical protein ASPZODRAFT_12288 [Penicilliopsis zonata CBS 506.65]
MPYNTRRKSLSLPSLGIHVPSSSRRSPSVSKASIATNDDNNLPPAKKVKRSHDTSSLSPEPQSASSMDAKDRLPGTGAGAGAARRRGTFEHTPPPSPTDGDAAPKIDTDGINDDVVVAVIEQLQKTGNRPHLVKELAAVLVTLNDNVANSANPAALLSSRLGTYLKRPWTALAPCPLAKELVPIHPRKVYYYLTTLPRQPIPETVGDLVIPAVGANATITPSVSSLDQDEEDVFTRQRSPSPEVDLSSPEFDDEDDSNMALSDRANPGAASRAGHHHGFTDHRTHPRLIHSHRAASPPLEGDEKEFTQTASAVRERASEEKASRLTGRTGGGGLSAISEGLLASKSSSNSSCSSTISGPSGSSNSSTQMQDGNMSISGTPMDDGERMSDEQYSDYFSHISARQQEHDLDEAAAAALFGTSPSPSLVSVASSISSGTSIDSDGDLDTEEDGTATATAAATTADDIPNAGLLGLRHHHHAAAVVSKERAAGPASTLKRSIDMLNSGLPGVDMKMSDVADWDDFSLGRGLMGMDVDVVSDSWIELQSPETVEVDELDKMFGEI